MKPSTITIRTAQKSDQEQGAKICFLASPVADDPRHKEIIHLRWSTPYFETVPEHCFVAIDHDKSEKLVGYVLCAPDTAEFEKNCYSNWQPVLKKALREVLPEFPIFERIQQRFLYRFPRLKSPGHINKIFQCYPAHLHINILPDYQRIGLGSRLMDTLISHLKENHVKGLHLWVDAANEKGVNFYQKYGFQQVRKVGIGKIGSICFGLKFRQE